jgi:hypothetical protein
VGTVSSSCADRAERREDLYFFFFFAAFFFATASPPSLDALALPLIGMLFSRTDAVKRKIQYIGVLGPLATQI